MTPDPTLPLDEAPAHDTGLPGDAAPIPTPTENPTPATLDTNNDDPTMAIFNVVANAVSAPGPPPRLELLEDYYTYLNGTPLRTVVLRIIGHDSVSEYILPTSNLGLRQLPVQQFIRWARAFEQGEFGIPDTLSPGQRRLLVDFARTWEFFARTPFVHRDWEIFANMLRSLASDQWSHASEDPDMVDGGYAQLSILSDWARNTYPAWFGINPAPGGGVILVGDLDGEALVDSSSDTDSDGSMPSLVDEYALSDASLD